MKCTLVGVRLPSQPSAARQAPSSFHVTHRLGNEPRLRLSERRTAQEGQARTRIPGTAPLRMRLMTTSRSMTVRLS